MTTITSSRRRTIDIAQGVASLLAAAALLVAVPLALAVLAGWPLPRGVPSPGDVLDALGNGDLPDGVLVKALACVLWLVWAQLAVAFIAESVAVARGRSAGTVPAVGGIRRSAARLVAGIALLGAVAPTARAIAPLVRPETPPPAMAVMASPAVGAAKPLVPLPDAAPLPEYEVQRRDTLWDIAERHLGDGLRCCEIYDLNKGAPQPGGRSLDDADLVLPGWRLRLPADAVGVATPAPPVAPVDPSAPAEPSPDVVSVSDNGDSMVRLDSGGLETMSIADAGDVLVRLPAEDET